MNLKVWYLFIELLRAPAKMLGPVTYAECTAAASSLVRFTDVVTATCHRIRS